MPDLGNGMYKNPIVFADYSDPDVVKVGDDFYMTASSFNCVPALPILHSKDLVNWTLINHAIQQFQDPAFNRPQHGKGVWAPAIRYHNGEFYIYYGDPDRGIYMLKTENPSGRWSDPVLVKKAYGNIDPCPLWDDDGRVYLVHAFAHSRAGVKSLLQVNELSSDGTKILDKGIVVFDGHQDHPTIEGPKFIKRNGYYYIFAPAGGVSSGWQTVLRSGNIYGPYEDRIVMAQGSTPINGPHQGAYLELDTGECWFVHFQDRDAYGRIVHLQPVHWKDDWPIIGVDEDGDGKGEPVLSHKKPDVGSTISIQIPQTTDEFNISTLGLQWQWHANQQQQWYSLDETKGKIRLYAQPLSIESNLWEAPFLLLQKFPAPEFTVTASLQLHSQGSEKAGLIIMGRSYAYIAITTIDRRPHVIQSVCYDADQGESENLVSKVPVQSDALFLSVAVKKGAVCSFQYSLDGTHYHSIGQSFSARPGKWIGAKAGIFASAPKENFSNGFAEVDLFSID
ncbi:glycoside hydrolase 43 family protein [bacterium]|nr:glycoside hydrolase 43 family protein [bacterium]